MLWRYEITGVDTITLHFGDRIELALTQKVHTATRRLSAELGNRLIDCAPSYTSIMLRYDLLQDDLASLMATVVPILSSLHDTDENEEPPLVNIPVFYHPSVGPDLERIAGRAGISTEQVIELHTAQTYHVFAIGFAPGFAYLGEVPKSIATPRLATPRQNVPAGSLGIADTQTAIYPRNSPGGWNIIGRTPLAMFDTRREPNSLLQAGQRVRFHPINRDEYLALGGELDGGFAR